MTQQAFQTAWARLIVEPDFRDAVRAGVQGALGTGLTPLEGSRLVRIAAEVMSYERATLDLERARPAPAPHSPPTVRADRQQVGR